MKRLKYKDVLKLFQDKGCRLLTPETEYKNQSTRIRWVCPTCPDQKKEKKTSVRTFRKNDGCRRCSQKTTKRRPSKKGRKNTINVTINDADCTVVTVPITDKVMKRVQRHYKLYSAIKELCREYEDDKIYVRSTNLPEIISESVVAYHYNAVIVKKIFKEGKGSISNAFDCLQLNTGQRLQIKACGSCRKNTYDCTSFGPESFWDKLLFITFAGPMYHTNERKEGDYEIYEISDNYQEFINTKVTKSGTTFLEQAKAGRRPRLSLFKTFLLNKGVIKVKPTFTGNVYNLLI